MNAFKYCRRIFLVNQVVAFFIKTFRLKLIEPKWPLKGVVNLKVSQVKIKFYSNCDDYLVSNIFYGNGCEEIREIEMILSKLSLKDNLQFMDIGAYNGLFSIALGKLLKNSNTFAFEPNPVNFERLRHNVALNGLVNVYMQQTGISDKPGFLEMYLPEDDSMTTVSSYDKDFIKKHTKNALKAHKTKIDTIDSICEIHRIIPDFIKIDVENHELEVILGGEKTIEKHKPVILCEIFTKVFPSNEMFKKELPKLHALETLLIGLGYKVYMVDYDDFVEVNSLNCEPHGRNFLFVHKW